MKKPMAGASKPPAKPKQAVAAVPNVVPAVVALHPSGHDAHAKPSMAHEADAHGSWNTFT